MKVLSRGMEGLNQAEVGTCLQVFYNMGELRATVERMIEKYKSVGLKSVSAALDMKAISASAGGGGGFSPGGIRGSGTPQIGGGAKAREALCNEWRDVWISCIRYWLRFGTCRGFCRRSVIHLLMCCFLTRLFRWVELEF
ncbi:hypothetical protein L484_020934 [Morus notabilis]|uniref:Conserved oligomeric Golgi complex subunit 5 helical domain-containing protein n=1 Tax=Morus notabilis TaxID=981085 RepID=W9QP25_9ROSA|nr:hypothetical protein L484_020934 [Morus notabilis]